MHKLTKRALRYVVRMTNRPTIIIEKLLYNKDIQIIDKIFEKRLNLNLKIDCKIIQRQNAWAMKKSK